MIDRRALLAGLAAALPARADTPWPARLIAAAQEQVGVTVRYDPAYTRLAYPGGDVPRERGVCTDVVIRAYRDAFGLDLQRLVHEDMARAFSAYPRAWGLSRPDSNIVHRRVPNLEAFFKRRVGALALADYRPGDLVTQRLPGNLPHIMIVVSGQRVVHNIGAGTQQEDALFDYPIAGHFRFPPQRA